MQHEIDKNMHFETNLLNAGSHTKFIATNPESLPIHLTTAHNVEDLDDLEHRYEVGGFCYNRSKNPNRTALIGGRRGCYNMRFWNVGDIDSHDYADPKGRPYPVG